MYLTWNQLSDSTYFVLFYLFILPYLSYILCTILTCSISYLFLLWIHGTLNKIEIEIEIK
jgi:ABC-type antimicrobial peptide transport system permease subunit